MGLRSRMSKVKKSGSRHERAYMTDAQAFLGSYKESLNAEVASTSWPPDLAAIYTPESCLKYSDTKEVYLVTDKRTGGRVILRVSNIDSAEQTDAEQAILSRLNYPGIPHTYGVYLWQGRNYLAREYFEGLPLDQVIARGVMQAPQIYPIALQLCDILGYIHSQNPPVIHRDIKPENIIMQPNGSIGLTDFGIARTYKAGSSSDTHYMGTLPYAPPEQYGYAQSSRQTDIYALGIVLIYLATGSPDRRDLDKRINDPQLRALIEKCIAFDPKDRFKGVEQVEQRIHSLKTRKFKIGGFIAAGALVLVLAGGGVWFVLSQTNNDAPESNNTPTQADLVDPNTLSEGSDTEYSSTGDPRLGSTSWLYDYNNGGNLHANINQGGFAVSEDSGNGMYVAAGEGIYHLDAEGNITAQVYEGEVRGSLNIYKGKLFFVQDSVGKLYYVGLSDSSEGRISGIEADRIYFDSGRMYCTNVDDSLRLYSVKTNDTGVSPASNLTQTHYVNIVDGVQYYADGGDGYRIYAQNLTSGDVALLYDNPAHWLSVCNGRIYFMEDKTGVLASIALDGSDYTVVNDNPCYQIVASPRGIVAIDAITQELVIMDTNGGHKVLLDEKPAEFCVAGNWAFYRMVKESSAVYMVNLDGSQNHQIEF